MKTSTTQPLSLPVRLTRSLRTPFWKKTVSSILLAQFALWSVQVKGATYDWDPVTGGGTLAGAGAWDATNINWWNGTSDIAWPNLNDTARFGGTAGGVVTLGSAVSAGGLIFNTSGYTLAGNTLTLDSANSGVGPSITVGTSNYFANTGLTATIGSIIAGTEGLSKAGNGTLVLSNSSNSYTGATVIKGGVVSITNPAQLGASTGTVGVFGINANGFQGGVLQLQGGSVNNAGMTFTRDLSLAGRGINAIGSGALTSIGNNTISGDILSSSNTETRIVAIGGTTTLAGRFVGASANNSVLYGPGNFVLTGQVVGGVSGTSTIVKGGTSINTTLTLTNNNNTMLGGVRAEGGFVRVSDGGQLGLGNNTGIASGGNINFNGATFEIRSDTPASFATKNISYEFGGGTVFVDRAIGTLGTNGINQTFTFANLRQENNRTFTFSGRNGYNVNIAAVNNSSSGNANDGWTNSGNGTVTINGSIWGEADGTARTLTLTATGEMVLTGSILAPSAVQHTFTKAGTGVLTIGGSASSFVGSSTLSAGTVDISSIGALNSTGSGRVVFGGGTLNYTGAGETWTNKVLLTNATNNILTNSGSGALIVPQNVGINNVGARTLVLGGANANTNDIQGLIVNNNLGTGVTKFDSGTWQISSPGTTSATIGTANATFGITAVGATATQTITTTDTSTLRVGQRVSGTGVPFGTVVSQIISGTQFAVSQSVASTGTTLNIGTVTGSNAAIATTAASTGTTAAPILTFTSTANLVPGQQVTGTGLTGSWYISAITSGTQVTLASTTGNTVATGAVVSGATITPSLSPNFAGPLTVTGGTVQLNQTSGNPVLSGLSNLVFAADPIQAGGFAGGALNFRPSAGGSQTAGILSISAGSGTVQITGTSGTNTLTFGSLGTLSNGTSLNLVTSGAGSNSIGLTVSPAAVGLVNARAYFNGSDFAYNPTASSAVSLRAPVYGTDAGFNAVAAAASLTAASSNLINATSGTSGAVSSAAATINSIKMTGSSSLAMTGNLTVGGANGGGILVDGSSTAAISGTGVTTNSTGDLVIRVNGASDILTLSAPVTATTTGGITKNGGGTLILSGTNAENGTVTINEGTIRLSGTGTLGSNNVNLTLRQGTTLDVNGVTTVNASNFQGAGTVTNSAASGNTTLVIGNNNGSQGYFSGTLQDGATSKIALTKTGAGNIAIGGAQNYSGSVNLNGGALLVTSLANIGQASGLGKGDATSAFTNQSSLVFNGGTLVYTGSNASSGTAPLNVNIFQQTQTPSVSTDRQFTLAGNGTIRSSGTYGNNILANGVANNATLIFSSTADLTFSGTGTRTLTLGGTSTGNNELRIRLRNNSNAGEALSLTKADAGLWILNPGTSNDYTGATTVSGGALQVPSSDATVQGLSAGSLLTLSGGVLQTSGTFTRTLGSAAGNVQLTGGASGFAASTAPLTVTLGGGAITWGGATFNPSALTLNSTTALDAVNFTNDLNLNVATRTITVNDNGSTGTDYAILSGVISGSGASALTKAGGGLLYITGDNTYNGNTAIQEGQVAVTSIGSGGASSNFGNATGSLTLGNAGTGAPTLMYYGTGENVTRSLIWNSTTGNTTIDSSGSGPIILSNFTQTGNGNKTLVLRGFNTDANTISSAIGNAGGGATSVTKNDAGTWILTGANTYTGTTTVSSGYLGIGGATGGATDSPLPGALTLGGNFVGAGIFATNPGGLIISSTVTLTQAQTISFAGTNSITLGGTLAATTGGDPTLTNVMSGGTLTINGSFTNPETSTNADTPRTLNIRGTGNTIWNGAINLNTASTRTHRQLLNISIASDANFTISGTPTFTNATTGTTTLSQGNLILGRTTNVFGGANTQTFAFNGGTLSSTNDLSGVNAIVNPVTLGGTVIVQGTNSIELNNATALALGASRSLINNVSGGSLTISGGIVNTATSTLSILGSGNTLISGVYAAGTGTNALAMLGTGNLTITNNNAYTGASTFTGGTTTLSGNGRLGDGTVTVNQGATLTLDNDVSGNPGTADRLDNRALALNGANFNFIGLTTTGSDEGTAGNTLTIGSGQTTFNITNNGGTTQMDFTILTTITGGFTNFTSNAALGTATNRIIFSTPPTLVPAATGILSRATVAGSDFATYGANGIAAFSNYNNGGAYTNINSAAASDTVKVGTGFVTADDVTANRTVNGLNIEDTSARAVSGVANGTLTLTSGAVLVEGGGSVVHTLSVPRISLGAEGSFHIAPATTLDVTGTLTGTTGLNKNLGGTLTFTGAQFYAGTTTVNNGTLNLSFGANTLFPGQALTVNQTGVVNLNNNNQYVGNLVGGTNPGSGGTINLGTGLLAINSGNTIWAGNISGNGNFARMGGNATLTMESANAYAGTTTLMGGVTTLRDNATLLNTSSIDINYASLLLRNNDNLQTDITDRINNVAPITLRGGLLDFQGRALNASSELFGTLTSVQGANRITSTAGGGGSFNSASITFTSLNRLNGSTVDFSGTILGQAGNQGSINFTTAPATVGDQLLGSWAIANNTDYAAYNNTMGVGALGSGGFTGYDWQDIATANVAPTAGIFASGNVTNLNATAAASTLLPAGTTNTGLLRFGGGFTNELFFTAGTDTLNLTLGGILRSNNNNNTNIGTTAVRGIITSGISELVVYNNNGTTTINSSIQGATKLIKSGGGTLTLTAPNTYSLGTVINQGTVNISPTVTDGTVVVIPNGGLTINGGIQNQAVTVTQSTQGSIGSTNDVTINGRATLTLTGNNTLNSFTLNNNGGEGNPTLAVGNGILTVSSTTPFTATSSNAATTNTVSGSTVVLTNGANTIDVGAIAVGSQVYNAIAPTLNISSILTGAGNSTSVVKDGAGLLQLSAQNTFLGGVDVTEGGIVLGANSTNTVPNGLVSGPLGIGTTAFASGTTLFVDNNDRQVANAMTYASNPIFNNTGTTLRTLTLNGALSFATQTTTGVVASIPTPFLNVVLGGPIANIGTVTAIGGATGANTITKTGLGNISGINLTGVSNTATINVAGLTNATSFSLLHDGNGTGSVETINLGPITWEPTTGTVLALTINRAGAGVYFPTPIYKTLAPSSFTSSLLPNGLTLTNSSFYGLLLADDIAFNTVSANQGPTFNVSTASTSLQVDGLKLSGLLSGGPTGASALVFTKSGAGTLALTNAGNSFGGSGSIIEITGGYLAVGSDAVLGDSTNVVRINTNSATQGFRATDTFATSRTFVLQGAANNGIEVARDETLTLNTALSITTATTGLTKNDFGTLVLTQAQLGWDGVVTINQGVLRITDAGALGTTTGNTTFGTVGGALELSGGISIAEPLAFASGDDVTTNGVNGGGAVRSVSGINTLTGAISLNAASGTNDRSRAATFTADLGATLNIDGVVTGTVGTGAGRDSWIGLGGAGDGSVNTAMAIAGTVGTDRFFSITKFGSGTWNLTAANAFPGTRISIKQGTLALNGAGTLGTPTVGQETTATVYLNPTGVLSIDNTASNVDNRLTGRAINLSSGDVNVLGNSAAATTETVGIFTLREGLSKITLDADAAQQLNFTTGAVTRSPGASLLIRADGFGSAAANGVAAIRSGGTGYVYVGQTGATGTSTKSIVPWALGDTSITGDGIGFVTADSIAGDLNTGANTLRLLAPSEQVANLTTANANANVNLTTAAVQSSAITINSLQLSSGGGATLNYVPLTLDSGGLLALSGNTGISGFSGVSYLTATSGREIIVHSVGDLTLDLPIANSAGAFTKSGVGTLTLKAGNNTGTVYVNDGTLKLDGGNQTLFPTRSLQLNEGGTLDLNGTVQNFNFLESRLTAYSSQSDLFSANSGGIVSNSSATQATLSLATGNVTFAGDIQGNIAVARAQAAGSFQDWNLYSNQTYTGPTLLNGGRTVMQDGARFSATSSIEITNGTLLVNGNNASADPSNYTDRINNAATISLRGGNLQLRARFSLYTTETLGAVTLLGGNSSIDVSEGGTRNNQLDITIASLARTAGSRATVRFYNMDATPNDDARLFITAAPTLSNNIIGGWAVFEREFASYTSGQGVGGLNTAGFVGYSPSLINAATSTDNVRIGTASATLLTNNRTANTLAMVVAGTSSLDLNGFTLSLAGGGLIASNSTNNTAITILNGDLTSGALNVGGDLYLHTFGYVNGDTDTVNRDVNIAANLVNNGTGPVTVVINAGDGRGTGLAGLLSGETTTLSGENSYSGGTFVNAGRVVLSNPNANGTTSTATGTGNLTISGGANTNGSTFEEFRTTVLFGSSDQIANTATVTVLGSAALNLSGFNQTLAGLIFNNSGGHTPNVATGVGTLTLTGDITASGQSAGTISTIDGNLNFGAATRTITVNPVEWNSDVLNPILPNLLVNASIQGTNIIKAGNGVLRLSGSNAFTGSFDLQAGGLSLGSNNALSTGALTIGDGTFLTSTADNRAITNAYTVSGDFALRDNFNLALNGLGTLPTGDHEISVELATKSLTLGGIVSGAMGNLTKTGNGILVLGAANTYGGSTTVSDGVLRYGVANAVPVGTALSVLAGGLLDITNGGTAITVGSLVGDSATAGGVIVTTATSGTVTFTSGANDTSTAFGGVLTNAAGSTLNFVKTGTGTLTLGGANTYNGSTTVVNGRLVAKAVSGNSPLGTSQALVLGGGTTSGILQLGDSAAALNHTFTSLSTAGNGTLNKIVSGNASMATLTLDLASTSTFAGNIGGAGTNEANLNLIKSGVGDLSITGSGISLYTGTTTVSAGKLFMDSTGAFPALTAGLTLADGTEFSLRGTSNVANQVYGFSGTGNVVTVGTTTGATLGFGIDGGFNSQLDLLTGQTMTVNGTLTTAIYVNNAPTAASYILINAADDNAIFGSGTFNLNPVVFNGGSFTYALSQVTGGAGEQWVLTPTAQPAFADVWWKGDLTGLAQGVWSATLTSGTGFPSNWDHIQASATAVDAQVPPDQFSIVHFSSDAAANLTTTLGANLTIQDLIFHTGNGATSIGNSNGTNTLTLGNTVDASGLTIQAGAADVTISAVVALPQDQSWNINDTARQLTISGGLTGTSRVLTVNDTAVNPGSLIFSGTAATLTGTLNMNAGTLIFDGTGSLNGGTNVVLGTAAKAATLSVGNTAAATNVIIGGLSNGTFAGSRVIGGNATLSTLTIGAASGSATFSGALGGVGTNENAFNLVKDGAGTQILSGTINTYSGTTTVRQGTLQLGSTAVFAPTGAMSIIANAGTTASFDFNGKSYTTVGNLNLGGGANGIAQFLDSNGTKGTITLGGDIIYSASNNPGAALVSTNFSASANRIITVGDSSNAATDLSLSGAYNVVTDNNLTINGAGSGAISGNINLNLSSGTGASNDFIFASTGTWAVSAKIEVDDDININSGTLNASVGESLDALDDIVITGSGAQGTAIVNISSASQVHTGDAIFIRGGGQVNVTASGGIGTGTDAILIGDSGSGSAAAAGLLNLVSANISPTSFALGATGGQIGNITGTGTITTTAVKTFSNGSIASGISLAGAGAITKNTTGVVTFAGTRDAAVGATNLQEGELILDYTTNNISKIGGVLTLGVADTLTSRILTLNGNASAATTQSVTSTTLSAGRVGPTTIAINNGTGQTASLALGAITRTTVGSTLAFEYSSASAGASSTSPVGTLGWATVEVAGVKRLAAINGSGNIVQAATTSQNNSNLWQAGQNMVNTAGYFGTTSEASIESLTFVAAAASNVTIATGNRLVIKSGGILVDSSVNAFNSTITGGQLYGALTSSSGSPDGELIIHQNNTLGSLTIASAIVNSSGLTKTGAGNLVLSGTNSFRPTAQVNINGAGTLTLTGGNAIADTIPILMVSGAHLALTNSETIGNLILAGITNISLGANTLTLNQTAAATISGVISGSGSFVKNGAGTLTITGDASSTGPITVNGGALVLSGAANGGFNDTTDTNAITLNGAELRSVQDQSANADRIDQVAPITLNNTAGTNGLTIENTNQNANRQENVGAINLGFGHNVVTALPTQNNSAAVADIVGDSLSRGANRSTLLVRGLDLGSAATTRKGLIHFDTAGQAAVDGAEVGGSGAATSLNISIIPWVIGDLTTTGLGNSFVTNVDAITGLRPLAAAEYTTDAAGFNALTAAAPSTNNVRFTTGATLTGTATAINSLVIDAATGQTVTGPANTIEITSGAILAASSGTTISHGLAGFAGGITTGGSRDYTVYVTSTTGTLNILAPLTSVVPLVKSGAGVLQLTNTGNAFTNLHINQGTVLAAANNVLGTGIITFSGGTLRLNTGYGDDLGAKTMVVLGTSGINGGGTIDTNGLSVTATNLNLSGSGQLTKTGAGTLTIAGAVTNTHTGLVLVTTGTLALNATGNPIGSGGLSIVAGANPTIVNIQANEQINNTAAVNVESAGSNGARFNLNGFSETIGSLTITGTTTNESTVLTGTGGVLTANGNITLNNNRDAAGNTGREVLITGTGTRDVAAPNTGTLNLGGAVRTITVQSANVAATSINADATIETIVTNGGIIKEGNRVLHLTGTNTYALATTINDGTLSINSSDSLGNASVTNTIAINNNAILRSTGASVNLGANRSVTMDGLGGRFEVTGSSTNILTVSGVISGDDRAAMTKIGTGILVLSGTNTYSGGTSVNAGALFVNNSTGSGTGSGDVSVSNSGTVLGGSGTVAGNLTVNAGALIAPGSAASTAGTLTIGGSTVVINGGVAETRVSFDYTNATGNVPGLTPATWSSYSGGLLTGNGGQSNDLLNFTAETTSLSWNTGGKISLNQIGSAYSWIQGDVFNLLDWTALSGGAIGGTFDSTLDFNLPTLGSGLAWDTTRFVTTGAIAVVPEPSRALLMLFGLMALFFRRRRQD